MPKVAVPKKKTTSRKEKLGGTIRKNRTSSSPLSGSKSVSSGNPKNLVFNELLGVLSLAFGTILFCALWSYSPHDSGLHVHGHRETLNWIGPGGALLADVILMLVGKLGYVLAALFFAVGILSFLRKSRLVKSIRLVGFAISFISLSILMDGVETLGDHLLYGPAGMLGETLNNILINGISNLGATIVALAGFVAGFILMTSLSIGHAFEQAGHVIHWGWDAAMDAMKWAYERIPQSDGFFSRSPFDHSRECGDPSRPETVVALPNPSLSGSPTDPGLKNRSFWDWSSKETEAKQIKEEEVAPFKQDPHQKQVDPNAEAKVVFGTNPGAPSTGSMSGSSPGSQVDTDIGHRDLNIIERDVTGAQKLVADAEKEYKKKVTPNYAMPDLSLLDYDAPEVIPIDQDQLKRQAVLLEKTFGQFGIKGHVREVRPGPVVTTYEFVPAPGIKLSRIAALADDIAMGMEAVHVRIVAPIPGKGAVGIEIPNDNREIVYLKEVVSDPKYRETKHKLTIAIGKDIDGKPYFLNLASMPHLLVAGTTGSGKSVGVNGMICSILYRATPEDVRFIMIDPKMLELNLYAGIPHLLLPPIIDSKKAGNALRWAVREMEERYKVLSELGVRDIVGYNLKLAKKQTESDNGMVMSKVLDKPLERLPYIVIVVDEYADLIAVGGKDVEHQVMRLAQKARAAGIHVILSTQRPSVDIITGVIKANFPVRIGFRLSSSHDSKTIINRPGSEKLLGKGDMLILPPGMSDLVRIHGAFVSETELNRVVDFWKTQAEPDYDMTIIEEPEANVDAGAGAGEDERYSEAVALVVRTQKCSTSWVQRHMGVGYNRAARMVEMMETRGVVGAPINARGDREIYGETG